MIIVPTSAWRLKLDRREGCYSFQANLASSLHQHFQFSVNLIIHRILVSMGGGSGNGSPEDTKGTTWILLKVSRMLSHIVAYRELCEDHNMKFLHIQIAATI